MSRGLGGGIPGNGNFVRKARFLTEIGDRVGRGWSLTGDVSKAQARPRVVGVVEASAPAVLEAVAAPVGLETLRFSIPGARGSGTQAMWGLNGWGQACEGGSGGRAGGQHFVYKAPGSPHPYPRYLDFPGDSCWAHSLAPLPSLKPGAGLCRGLLPSLLASNHLAPPCPSIPFLGKAATPANEDAERARTELPSVRELSGSPHEESVKEQQARMMIAAASALASGWF